MIVYVDGSFRCKTYKAGFGIVFPNREMNNISMIIDDTKKTNIRAELFAILYGIKYCYEYIIANSTEKVIEINTDSEFSINVITKWLPTWLNNGFRKADGKKVENEDIMILLTNYLNTLYEDNIKLNMKFIKGHNGDVYNEEADKLARSVTA